MRNVSELVRKWQFIFKEFKQRPLLSSKRDIPVVNYKMHTLHCARNVLLCPECDEPVPRSGLEEHNLEFHTEKECEKCGEKMANNVLEEHRRSKCSARVLIASTKIISV